MSKKRVIWFIGTVLLGIAFLSGVLPATVQAAPAVTDIKLLQRDLAGLGYMPMSGIDGVNGPQTRAAVRQYQKDQGLQIDGVAGPQTMAALTNEVKKVQQAVGTRADGDYVLLLSKIISVPMVFRSMVSLVHRH